jgi:hypothetical protein
MTRYRTYGKLDDPMREVGDTGFNALASREEPTQLQAGVVSEAKNVRMDDGKVTTRLGHTTQIDLTTRFILDEFSHVLTTEDGESLISEKLLLNEVYSADFFAGIGQQDRNQILLVQEDKILFWNGESIIEKEYETSFLSDPILSIYLDFILGTNESAIPHILASKVEAVQFNNQLILLTGKAPTLPVHLDFILTQKVQKWDGDSASEFVIDENIANGDFGIVTGNRLAVLTDSDTISFSDIADESNFDVRAKFTFGAGDGDNIVGMSPIPESSALVFKRRSCWAITGLNDIENASITQVSRQTGCVSRHSIQNVGSAVFFLGDDGVYAMDIGLDASNARGTLTRFDLRDEPLSKPINDQILAENFTLAEKNCKSEFFENRYYLSFSDDDTSRVYIFNTLIGAWESRDEFDFPITDFVRAKTNVDEKERLYVVTRAGKLFRMDDGKDDSGKPISWTLNTRAYDNQNLEVKNFRRGYAKVESLDSTGTVNLDVEVSDPDGTASISLSRPDQEGYIERFSIGKRGNSLMYKFSGEGRNSIKHLRAEFIESSNNTISTKQ